MIVAKNIEAVGSFIEKVGFNEALLVASFVGIAWLCGYIIKTNAKSNEDVKNKLKEVEQDQTLCHKDREALKEELDKTSKLNSELLELNNRSQLNIIAMRESHETTTKTFIETIKHLTDKN